MKAMQHKVRQKSSLPLHWAGENNLLPLQTVNSDQSEEALAHATATLSLLSLKDNSICMNLSQNSARMKSYFHHKQNHFFDYFKDPVPNGVVIYMGDVPFEYNERDSKYTDVLGSPTGIIFVGDKMDHNFFLNQISNVSNVSSNLNNFRQSNATGNSSKPYK